MNCGHENYTHDVKKSEQRRFWRERGYDTDMTNSRKKTLTVKAMQTRVIGKAMNAAKYGLQMRESAKTISMRTEERK